MTGIYLDNAATTPLSQEVADAMAPFLGDRWGNASSVHRRGVAAREAIDRARAQVARSVGASPGRVIFTGSGTEANNLALLGIMRAAGESAKRVLVGPTEHASVRAAAHALGEEGFEIHTGKLDDAGQLDLQELTDAADERVGLAAQMLVSNEFGSIYPTAQVARIVKSKAAHAWVHVDAIQALGKVSLSMLELGADSLALSAHKIHGPQGVGALVLARDVQIRPLVFGGGQENGHRSGTENLPAIVGFGCAAQLANERRAATIELLSAHRQTLRLGLQAIDGLRVLEAADETAQQPGILSLLVPGAPAEVWLHHLDASGVTVSVGSACQASKQEISPVLLAAGLDGKSARQVLRLSIGDQTTNTDIRTTLQVFESIARELAHL